MSKKILSMVLALVMVLGLLPASAVASGADQVYISVSFDGTYIDGVDAPIVYVPVSFDAIASVDLEEYGLGEYLYDENGDGTPEITALQLVIYAHENLYGGSWSDVTFTGSPGSSYFQGGIFGFDENLNYYLNGEYPLAGEGWGATSDQIVLEPGDFLDIASFSSWDFYMDSNYGFHFFADENEAFTHAYTAEVGTALDVKLVRSFSAMGTDATVFDAADYTISYGPSYGNVTGTVTTDGSGCASITFPTAGKWCLWADGGYGMEYPDSIVSAPAYAEVTVKGQDIPSEPTITLHYPTLVFEDMIMMNVYFSATGLENVVEMGLITYKQDMTQWNVDNAEEVIPGYTWSEEQGLYYATTNGIAAKNLNDTIYFAVYAKLINGTYTYTNLVSYSPKSYAYAQLTSGSDQMKPIVVAMLNYGAAAQTYFKYNTDTLVNADLTDDQKALVESYRANMVTPVTVPATEKQGIFAQNGGHIRRYPTVSFEGAFCINYYYMPSEQPVGNITMYCWNQEAFDSTDVLTAENATAAIAMTGEGVGEYHVAVDGIAAKDLDKSIYVAFTYDCGSTTYYSGVLPYSIGAYCGSQANSTTATAPLAQATAVYGYYANALFCA